MNLNPENTLSILTETPSGDVTEKVFTVLQPLSEFHADLSCGSSSQKRKWDEVAESVSSEPRFAGEPCSADASFTADDCNVGKIHAAVQCSDTAKRIRTMDRKEMNVLRIQIAMISDVDGDRPIHVAVAQENLKLVRKLCTIMLKSAISLDLTNYLRQTPLHLAVMLGNTDVVSLLLKYGASIGLRDRNGNSVIHLAVKTEANEDILDLILSHPESNSILNSLDHEGYSALHYAVLKNNEIAARCLHRAGAWLNTIDGKSGRSPLIHAVVDRNFDMVSLLLEMGASAEVTDYSGRSVFDMALQSSDKKITKLLEKHLFADPYAEGISQKDSKCKSAPSTSHAKRTRTERTSGGVKTSRSDKKSTLLDET